MVKAKTLQQTPLKVMFWNPNVLKLPWNMDTTLRHYPGTSILPWNFDTTLEHWYYPGTLSPTCTLTLPCSLSWSLIMSEGSRNRTSFSSITRLCISSIATSMGVRSTSSLLNTSTRFFTYGKQYNAGTQEQNTPDGRCKHWHHKFTFKHSEKSRAHII